MTCPYCNAKSKVTNSRPTDLGTRVWRRRSCKQCIGVWSTSEVINLETSHAVYKDAHSAPEPLRRDKVLIMINDSLQHRKSPENDASALTDTVFKQVLLQKSSKIYRRELNALIFDVLKNYNRLAADVFKAKND